MDLERCWELIHELERAPAQMSVFYGELEAAIRWLMDTTFTSKDPAAKVGLDTTEAFSSGPGDLSSVTPEMQSSRNGISTLAELLGFGPRHP